MDKSGIPGKWFFSELVFKGLVYYLSTEDSTTLPVLYIGKLILMKARLVYHLNMHKGGS